MSLRTPRMSPSRYLEGLEVRLTNFWAISCTQRLCRSLSAVDVTHSPPTRFQVLVLTTDVIVKYSRLLEWSSISSMDSISFSSKPGKRRFPFTTETSRSSWRLDSKLASHSRTCGHSCDGVSYVSSQE